MSFLHRKKGEPQAPTERLDPLGFPEPPKNVRPPNWQPADAHWAPAPSAPRAPALRALPPPRQEWPAPPRRAPEPRPAPQWPAPREPAPQERPEPDGEEWNEGPSRGAPPVFIKIDRYRDVVRDVQRLKATSGGLRDALDSMADLQRELQASTTVIAKALDKFNNTLTALDAKFVRVGGVEETELPPQPIGHHEIQSQVQGLHEQMQRLRTELKDLE